MIPLRRGPAGRAALFVALAALGGACAGERAPEAVPGGPAGQPRRGGTLVAGTIADLDSVNEYIVPSSRFGQDILYLMFLRLVEEQPDFAEHPPTLEPMLAERWEWSEDRLSLTFDLRPGLVWSDGVPVTAEDVRWTWEVQTHPEVAWDNVQIKDIIRDVEVLDPLTVRFHLTQVRSTAILDVNEGSILPKHAWEKLPLSEWRGNADWFREHLVVSGPFTLASWRPQQELVLRRNERYHEAGLPYLDGLVVRVIPDRANQFTQVLAGELDVVEALTPAELPQVLAAPHLELIRYWSRGYAFVGWNLRRPLFADPAVRRALTMSIERHGIVDAIYGEYARVAVSPILSNVWAFNEEIEAWPYDPREAERLLAAAGWRDRDGDGLLDRDGRPFSFELVTNIGNQQRIDAMVMIQEQLRRVGIEAKPRFQEFNALGTRLERGEYDAVVMAWSMPTDLDLRYAFHTDSIAGGVNYSGYSNPELDRLIDLAKAVPDIEDAKPYLLHAQEIIHRDQPFTFLWEPERLSAVNRRVRDASPNVLRSYWHLWQWWIEEK